MCGGQDRQGRLERASRRQLLPSPITDGKRIFFLSEEGKTTVVAAKPEFKVLATNQLDGGFMASPAVHRDALILRTKTHLYRVANKK